jgi:hypothetical protein
MEKKSRYQKQSLPGHPLGLYQIDVEESPRMLRVPRPEHVHVVARHHGRYQKVL